MSKCISVFVFFCKWRFTIYKKVCIKPTKLQKEFKIIIKCNFFVLVLSLYICKMWFRTVPFFSMEVFNVWTILSSVSSSRYSLMLQKEFWWNSLLGNVFILFVFVCLFWIIYFFFSVLFYMLVLQTISGDRVWAVSKLH